MLLVGRVVWAAVANGLGVTATPTVPVLALVVVVAGAFVLINLTAYLPARSASQTRPESPCVPNSANLPAGSMGRRIVHIVARADAKTDRRISRFRGDAERDRYLQAYDRALAAWPVAPTELDVPTRYGTTHIHSCGATEGSPIVLLHAVAVSSPLWFANVAALGDGHPVYAIDTITDAGRSVQTAAIRDGADLATWLDETLAALDLRAVHLVGLSFGGWLALNQARRSPGRLASVTAVDPPGAIGRMKMNVGFLPDAALAMFAKSEPALHRLLQRLNNGKLPPSVIVDLSVAGLRLFNLKQPFPKRMSDEELASIVTPMLFMLGDQSPVTNAVRAVERVRRLVPDIEVEVVPDAGHMLPVEHASLFNDRMLRFIDAH
jgi:pimeloyl-ACP methyl ester carboxylesterase